MGSTRSSVGTIRCYNEYSEGNNSRNNKAIGMSTFLVEGVADDGIFEVGRIPEQAPEIDSMTYVASEIVLTRGQRYPITIVEAEAYELTGVCSEFT